MTRDRRMLWQVFVLVALVGFLVGILWPAP